MKKATKRRSDEATKGGEIPARTSGGTCDARHLDLGGEWFIGAGGERRPITIPCAWQTVLGENFHGAAVLRRTVRAPAPPDRPGARRWLRFESVATALTARVDGREVGRHVGDWVPFQFEVTGAAGAAAFEIELDVDEIAAQPRPRDGPDWLQGGHITKGFHDVLSLQHGGVWQPVHLVTTGALAAVPDGVCVRGGLAAGVATATVELEPHDATGLVRVTVADPAGRTCAEATAPVARGERRVRVSTAIADPRPWSPAAPDLYIARVELRDEHGVSDARELRFGFRELAARGRRILLNGAPVFLRGVLDWGHEPATIAPAPAPDAVRERFARLRALGFNTVCLCMWYAPRHLYEIADETGMLIWQIHPVWQSRMGPEHRPEYRRHYEAFFRRDRAHPSVIVVSATCEHPALDPELARWWWRAARAELPGTLCQTRTASFAWQDPRTTDLYDEHTYDNNDRWVAYMQDLGETLAALPAKPFVMGETALWTAWPDLDRYPAKRAWWFPRGFERMAEMALPLPDRGERYMALGRKFQVEQFRWREGHAGIVVNHLRDVPQCQCGLADDHGRWRVEPDETRGWLGDRALLLHTPGDRRGFAGGTAIDVRLGLSNFGDGPFDGALRVTLDGVRLAMAPLRCEAGEIAGTALRLALPGTGRPRRLRLSASAPGVDENAWDLWALPTAGFPAGAVRLAGAPFTQDECAPDEVERGYSRGFGLPARAWRPLMPDPARLAPDLPARAAPPEGARVLLAHRLTGPVAEWLAAGGRVVLLASKAAGALGTRYEWLFGGVPVVYEQGPLRGGDRDWLTDLLVHDLVRRTARVIPSEDLGIAGAVEPLVRFVSTHDRQRPAVFDMVLAARAGDGLLVATSLDHAEDAGRYLLARLLAWAADPEASCSGRLDRAHLDSLVGRP